MSKIIDDRRVNNVWYCPECMEKVEVNPDYYAENGTPVCSECDVDMNYHHTEIVE